MATIKAAAPDAEGQFIRPSPGHLTITNMTLLQIIRFAYGEGIKFGSASKTRPVNSKLEADDLYDSKLLDSPHSLPATSEPLTGAGQKRVSLAEPNITL